MNFFGRDTGRDQLIAIRLLQIDTRMTVAGRCKKIDTPGKTFREEVDYFAADFIAAAVRCGADGSAQVLRERPVFAL